MSDEATARPWKISVSVHIYSAVENGGNACSVSSPRTTKTVGYSLAELWSDDINEAYANAELIVRAVNTHEAALSALREAREYVKRFESVGGVVQWEAKELIARIDALLAPDGREKP